MNPTTGRFVFNASESPNNFITSLIGTLNDGTTGFRWRAIKKDNAGNIYAFGPSVVNFDSSNLIVAKMTQQGSLLWQNYLGQMVDGSDKIAVDSSNNLYCAFRGTTTNVSGNSHTIGILTKYNPSGALQFQRTLASTEISSGYTQNLNFFSICCDSSDNIYVAGNLFDGVNLYERGFVVKYNTSGIIQWQRVFSNEYSVRFVDIDVDAAGNVYAVGGITPNTGGSYELDMGIFCKINSSGTLQYTKAYNDPLNIYGSQINNITISNNNAYCRLSAFGSPGNWEHLIKITTATGIGLEWQKRISYPGNDYFVIYQIASLPGDDSVLMVGGGSAITGAVFSRYSSNGSTLFNRAISLNSNAVDVSGWYVNPWGLDVSPSNNNIYLTLDLTATSGATPNDDLAACVLGLRANGGNLGTFPFISTNNSLIISTGIQTTTNSSLSGYTNISITGSATVNTVSGNASYTATTAAGTVNKINI